MIEKIFQKDLFVKVAAVILALFMWTQAASDKNPLEPRVVNVEVKIENPPGKIATMIGQSRVAVTLEGRARTLAQITPEKLAALTAEVDLSKASVGRVNVLPVSFISPFSGVWVKDVTPKTVTVELNALDDKQVAVSVTSRGTPNKEFEADRLVVSVPTVRVSGPKNKLDQVQMVVGEIDVTGAVGTVTATVPLVPEDAAGKEVSDIAVEPAEVQVTVPMKARLPAKTVNVQVDTTGAPKAGYRVAKATASIQAVEIRGEAQTTRSIDVLRTNPVNIAGREASFSVTASLIIPSGVTAQTTKVTVNVEIVEDIVDKTFSRVPVMLESPPAGYTFDLDPRVVDIVLRGRSDVLAQISQSDVQPYINASGVDVSGPGDGRSFTASLWVLPRGLDKFPNIGVQDIIPTKVTLTLTKR